MFKQRMPATVFIAFWAIVIGLLIAVPVGVYSAYRRDGPFDRDRERRVVRRDLDAAGRASACAAATSSSCDSALPHRRRVQVRRAVGQPDRALQELLHPGARRSDSASGAVWSRLLRADMILTLQSDFIMLARAKGVSPGRVLWVHALRGVGAVADHERGAADVGADRRRGRSVETFFGPKGIGERLVFAIQGNDILIIQAITAVLVVGVVIANLVVDLLYAVDRPPHPPREATRDEWQTMTAPAPSVEPGARRGHGRDDGRRTAQVPTRAVVRHRLARPSRRSTPTWPTQLPWVRGENQRVEGAGRYRIGPSADFWFGSDKLGKDVFARCVYGAQALDHARHGQHRRRAPHRRLARDDRRLLQGLGRPDALDPHRLVAGRSRAGRGGPPHRPVRRAPGERHPGRSASASSGSARRWSIAIVFSLLSIAPVARIVRAQTLSLSEREYVLAARSLGARTPRILFREILPNLVPAMVSVLFTGIAHPAGGRGRARVPRLQHQGARRLVGTDDQRSPRRHRQVLVGDDHSPAAMLFMTVLAFNLIGDWVAKRFDIREAAI